MYLQLSVLWCRSRESTKQTLCHISPSVNFVQFLMARKKAWESEASRCRRLDVKRNYLLKTTKPVSMSNFCYRKVQQSHCNLKRSTVRESV